MSPQRCHSVLPPLLFKPQLFYKAYWSRSECVCVCMMCRKANSVMKGSDDRRSEGHTLDLL